MRWSTLPGLRPRKTLDSEVSNETSLVSCDVHPIFFKGNDLVWTSMWLATCPTCILAYNYLYRIIKQHETNFTYYTYIYIHPMSDLEKSNCRLTLRIQVGLPDSWPRKAPRSNVELRGGETAIWSFCPSCCLTHQSWRDDTYRHPADYCPDSEQMLTVVSLT